MPPSPKPELLSVDFDERPFTVAWELTRSCALACLHCRAEAQPRRHPGELTTDEARAVLDQMAELAPPVLVLTGGDPMMRPDLFEIVQYAVARGLRVAVSPTTTALTTLGREDERLGEIIKLPGRRWGLAADYPDAARRHGSKNDGKEKATGSENGEAGAEDDSSSESEPPV